ncbi:hypothetical protein AAFF_G00376690 [Aldrovandia affinis]|uniref:Uncharacterized protein n=1 Tax=Aldrovandia affinis TaxID=143900 RepID=A0AAD7WM10_9TELE|nr:hypothetical protein AAFF_G00376690 [Aldrovandia affinis]
MVAAGGGGRPNASPRSPACSPDPSAPGTHAPADGLSARPFTHGSESLKAAVHCGRGETVAAWLSEVWINVGDWRRGAAVVPRAVRPLLSRSPGSGVRNVDVDDVPYRAETRRERAARHRACRWRSTPELKDLDPPVGVFPADRFPASRRD